MRKILWILLSVAFPFISATMVYGQTRDIPNHYEIYEHWDISGKTFTVAWTKSQGENVVEYKWEAIQPEKNFAVIARGTVPQRDNPEASVKLDKAGHYILRIKACEENDVCSDWAESTDPDVSPMVGDEVKPWMIYLYLGAPSF